MKTDWSERAFSLERADVQSPIVLVCEHASPFIPETLENLGLPDALRETHIAWDPGAMDVAKRLSNKLGASLISGGVSRLVYDCNRPPGAVGAIPEESEIFDVPGNRGLSEQERKVRADLVYHPFHSALAKLLKSRDATPVLVTIHSFTPVYFGQKRETEIGILHDKDARLADAMLQSAETQARQWKVERNAPYGPQDGVTHTLQRHALPNRLLNVMIEVRNDLLKTPLDRELIANVLSDWVLLAMRSCAVSEATS